MTFDIINSFDLSDLFYYMKIRKIVYVFLCFSLFLIGNFVYAQELLPNDPDYFHQWYLQNLKMPQVWAEATGNKNVTVAVIDSGVDVAHPDLHDNIWVNQKEILGDNIDNDNNGYIDDINGWDFIDNSNDPSPKFEINCLANKTCNEDGVLHGTFIAGIIGAVGNNGLGITGVNWQVKIMPLRVLNQNGNGDTYDVERAIDYAINNGADIINLSFVGETYDLSLQQALEKAFQKGLLIFAAAGNEGLGGKTIDLDFYKMYPICHRGANNEKIIIGVGASDEDNKLADFSNFGSSCVDIIAPGQDFYSTLVFNPLSNNFNKYYGGSYSGTSLAVPLVSGLAALVKSVKPALTNREIMDLILNNADNIDLQNPAYVGKLGRGLLDPVKVFKALKLGTFKGPLIKGSSKAVYYFGQDSRRYVFPDTNTFLSWYDNYNDVKQISDSELAKISLGGNVTFRPGTLIKIQTDPKVYAVTKGGILRWVSNEQIVQALYGNNWQNLIYDIPDSFFTNYKLGEPILSASDYNPFLEKNSILSIDIDKGLM